jgi:hypothetical protein
MLACSRLRTVFLLSVLSTVVLTACSHDPKNAIVGEWFTASVGETLHFFPDGTVTIKKAGTETTQTYSFPDSDHIKIIVNGGQGAVVMKLELSSSTMKITDPKGGITTYKRAD